MFGQLEPDTQRASSLHVLGVRLFEPAQPRLPGLHSPVHSPAPAQMYWHPCPGSHLPMGLHACGVLFAPHLLAPGMHSPPQLPLEQTFGQTAPSTHFPFSSQVWVVRLFGPLHLFVPGLQSPVHWPWPLHTFSQGMAAGIHSPCALQVSGVWSGPQCMLFGLHIPAHAPAVQMAVHASFMTQAPATVHTSPAAPV